MGFRIGGLAVLVIGVLATSAHAASVSVAIDSAPPDPSNLASPTFTFHASSGAKNFECSIDGGASVACTSPYTTPSLAEGSHTFKVQLGTGASASHATYTWSIDLTPPMTNITQQPPSLTNSRTATFAFNSADPTATFLCSLNGSQPQPCSSPVVYNGLSDATRTLLIQAVDPAGNHDTQAQPITWTVDTTAPDTTLANPGNIVGDSSPQFTFSASEAGASFQCSFDDAAFSACASPDRLDVFHSGPHTFAVRAVDTAGNVDPTPATYSWTGDLTPPKQPKVTIFEAPSASASGASPVLKVQPHSGLGLTFTNPLSKLLTTPTFTLATKLQAQWKSDSSAHDYDVTVSTFPEDSTGRDERGDNVLEIKQYSHTKRTALTLKPGTGATVCVKVDARDKIGNVSHTKTACTTIPDSFAPFWGPYQFHRVKDSKAWRGYYIVVKSGAYLVQPIGDGAFFAPTKAVLVGERCHGCGTVELAFTKYPVGGHTFHKLATVDFDGKTDHEMVVNVKLPRHRLAADGNGYVVLLRTGGKPRLSGVGFTS